ncbi:hypothetical protein GALL_516530 [mine drainage metagenome]|uniref:CTP synthetase n=1 Tax=mine drainage metagenome TaxID=410659 RepID=A0A1J5PT82_9ZZZZ
MTRLTMLLFSIIATSLMGILIVAALVAGYTTAVPIEIAAGLGFVLGFPVSWMVAKAIA